jgi:hypothetical protein
MIALTCKNHPHLRWLVKSIAWSDETGYNACRNIFFQDIVDGQFVRECPCPASDLVRVPDAELTEEHKLRRGLKPAGQDGAIGRCEDAPCCGCCP